MPSNTHLGIIDPTAANTVAEVILTLFLIPEGSASFNVVHTYVCAYIVRVCVSVCVRAVNTVVVITCDIFTDATSL